MAKLLQHVGDVHGLHTAGLNRQGKCLGTLGGSCEPSNGFLLTWELLLIMDLV